METFFPNKFWQREYLTHMTDHLFLLWQSLYCSHGSITHQWSLHTDLNIYETDKDVLFMSYFLHRFSLKVQPLLTGILLHFFWLSAWRIDTTYFLSRTNSYHLHSRSGWKQAIFLLCIYSDFCYILFYICMETWLLKRIV